MYKSFNMVLCSEEKSARCVAEHPQPTAASCNAEGVSLWAAGHRQQALTAFAQSIELQSQFADPWCNLAAAAAALGDNKQAFDLFRHALTLDPALVRAHMGLGALSEKFGLLDLLTNSYSRAFALDPTSPEVRLALGSALARMGDPAGLTLLQTLVADEPDSAETHYTLSLSLLLHGHYPQGWRHHEARMQLARLPTCNRTFSEPRWQGEPLQGRSILLYTEQGFGDTLHFARYAPLVAARGGHVILEAQPGLQRLLSGLPGVAQCVAKGLWDAPGAVRPRFSTYAPLLSLPLLFGTQFETIPSPVAPTLPPFTPPSSTGSSRDSLKVGIVWAGDPRHHRDHLRSIPLAEWLPLAAVEGVAFASLQKGPAEAELALHSETFRIEDRCAHVQDFADTAAIVAGLDLVITVDTAVAHLAGTLGKPVWVLLHPILDWRWGLAGETTPWYPTARLFRRSRASSTWAEVIQQLSGALRELVARRSVGLC